MVSVFSYIDSSTKFEEVDWKITDLGRLKSSPFESYMDQYSLIYYICYVTHHPCRIAIPCRSRMNGMLISSCQKVISVFSPCVLPSHLSHFQTKREEFVVIWAHSQCFPSIYRTHSCHPFSALGDESMR